MVGAQTNRLTTGRILFFAVGLAVFGLDRLSKYLVVASIPDNTEIGPYLGFFWIQHIQNSCAAFSLCGPTQLVFLAISLAVVIALFVYELRLEASAWTHAILGLVWGGVAGNGLDRLLFGSVTDFFAVHWFPTFNVADSAITVGVTALVLEYLLRRRPSG
ncbi:MAG TPA: signal peptidase II [Candidatus Dormibacteraeota bacterium]|nr:signal peptidase II [Candidatus Dormibacteraeota bacterium]